MSDPSWQRVREIFEHAVGLDGPERSELLDAECQGDPELRSEVEELLHHAAAAPEEFLEPGPRAVEALPATCRTDDFEIQAELGRGGMGVVYRARQLSLDRDVALKVLVQKLTTTESEVERFHREARSMAKLDHPHIVRVFSDGGTDEVHWFAMELIDGHSLHQELATQRRRPPGEPAQILPGPGQAGHVQAAAQVARDVARALAHAHSERLIHRDIKPSNLLLTQDRVVKVADFGIARDESLGSLTNSDQVMGSLPYMSPEQTKFQTKADLRTDVYSLGVVLYELLTLEAPFTGTNPHEIVDKIRTEQPHSVRKLNSRVPRDLELVCHTAIAKQPSERYASASAFADDLDRFLAHDPVHAKPPSVWRRTRHWMARRRIALGAIAVAVAALAVGAWFASEAARGRQIQARLAPIQSLLAEPDWTRQPISRLATTLENVDQLLTDAALPDSDRSLVEQAKTRFDRLETDWLTQGKLSLESGIRTIAESDAQGGGFRETMSGFRRLLETAIVFSSEDATISEDVLLGRLSISSPGKVARPGKAFFRVLDPKTGAAGDRVALGASPLTQAVIPLGHLRINVDLGHGDVRSFSRIVRPGTRLHIELPDTVASAERMVSVPGGTLALDPDHSVLHPLLGHAFAVRPFLLDAYEVSNADYRTYLSANPDAPKPLYWSELQPSIHDQLPVGGLSWQAAQHYAEWAGKRLPSHVEWTWAARGAANRRFPWGNNSTGEYRGNTQQSRMPTIGVPEWIAGYFDRAAAVTSHADAATATGLHHLLGNVAEWAESHAAERLDDGVFSPRYRNRLVLGHDWAAAAQSLNLATFRNADRGIEQAYADLGIGFRCARSLTP